MKQKSNKNVHLEAIVKMSGNLAESQPISTNWRNTRIKCFYDNWT